MKLLVLDFDGVINSSRSFVAFHERSLALDAGDEDWHTWLTKVTIDPVAVELINKLTRDCDAKILISSSHRLWYRGGDLAGLITYTRAFGIEADIVDMTPYLRNGNRGEEIKAWMTEYTKHGGEIDSYVILDDDSDMLDEQMPFFVQTSWKNGLTFDHFHLAMKILSKGEINLDAPTNHTRLSDTNPQLFNYKEGDEVYWHQDGLNGRGFVRGVASEPNGRAGRMYIIEDCTGKIPTETYPFTSLAIPESSLELYEKRQQSLVTA